jgi:hypothetical protein
MKSRINRYAELIAELNSTKDEVEKKAILDKIEDLWYDMTDEEQEQVSK